MVTAGVLSFETDGIQLNWQLIVNVHMRAIPSAFRSLVR